MQSRDNKKLLRGEWHGHWDSINVTLVIKNKTGVIRYMPDNKEYNFSYEFKNDSVIRITKNNRTSLHLIRNLDKRTLHFLPFPREKAAETIDLIDAIDFEK